MMNNKNLKWDVGCNYIPQYATNQIEMWDELSFDLEVIDKELLLANSIGFNSIRVFLHHLSFNKDPYGFVRRIGKFLDVAEKYNIKVMFVLFDGVWNPNPKIEEVYTFTHNVHNSGWVQCPGFSILNDPTRYKELKDYVQAITWHFGLDERISYWDIFNEPDNENTSSYKDNTYHKPKAELALDLLKLAIEWIKEVKPTQPITMGPWNGNWEAEETLTDLEKYMFHNSDVISFHCYGTADEMENKIKQLQRYNKPLLCTEYMARPLNSTFEDILPLLKKYNVGAYCWGLVAGKTNTFCAWDSWENPKQPDVWFHDIFHADGTPYNLQEIEFLKKTLLVA